MHNYYPEGESMKKKLGIVLVVLLTAATGAFAAKGNGLALGAEISSSNFSSWGGMLTFHLTDVPLHFAIGGYASSGSFGLDLKIDYWLLHGNFASGFDWYIGLGGYLGMQIQPSSSFAAGVRLPLALQLWPIGQLLEIFVELAPAWVPFANDAVALGNFEIQPALGFRIWF
jgi:hypothetical protein